MLLLPTLNAVDRATVCGARSYLNALEVFDHA